MIQTFDAAGGLPDHDVCIVGAGPIGLALAFACTRRQLRVLVLESGRQDRDARYDDLGRAHRLNPKTHVPLEEGCCRALGGNSYLWGGRCVPFDPIDFEERPWIENSGWPISYGEVASWYQEAAAFLGCGDTFVDTPLWGDTGEIAVTSLEQWTPTINIAHRHMDWIRDCPTLTVLTGATVVDLQLSDSQDRVTDVVVSDGNATRSLPVGLLVVAGGGVQTPRLLLHAQRRHPEAFGGRDGPLGRFYMGHVSGKIAEMVLTDPGRGSQFDYVLEGDGFKRRRITLSDAVQVASRLPQITWSIGNPTLYDPAHGRGALSSLYLLLASPLGARFLNAPLRRVFVGDREVEVARHVLNVVSHPVETVTGLWDIYRQMFRTKPKRPSIFMTNKQGQYTLYYHAEQTPLPENRITLSAELDWTGLPRVDVDFAFSRQDAENIIRAHEALGRGLRQSGIGHLRYTVAEDKRVDAILDQARDGLHQIGTTRMSRDPTHGVVDGNLRVHGMDNLYIASTAAMPTSGHANPTFVGVALAKRLARHLERTASGAAG